MTAVRPDLVLIFGPPAVGKMTVGYELARLTGLRLFHNHQTIDLVLPYFEFGTPPFERLVRDMRRRLLEEVANSDLSGLISTFVWAFDDSRDRTIVEGWAEVFRSRGGRVFFVELEASLEQRLSRNESEFRLAQKPLKRDVEASRALLLQDDANHRLNSAGEFDGEENYLRIDTTNLSAADAAKTIAARFGLAHR